MIAACLYQPQIPTDDYLARLNPEQRQAVETVDGPLLVLAGAGTGKTRVLTTRFAHILLTGRAYPSQVLAVTFTNKAAREMRERVGAILGRPAEGLWLGTFHALCARMLRRHADLVGLSSNFTILDTDDQQRLLKQVMEAARIDTKRWTPAMVMATIQRWKDRGLTPARITPAEDTDIAGGRARELYATYQERLRALNAADFGDLLLHVTEILRAHPDVLADYHRRFRYILVDEYQDTNLIQYLWLRLLAQGHHNLCCVGDDDQSIYSWRGAEVENILRFEKDFEGAKIVRLESNYRSTAPILAAAAALIAHNEGRLGKTLRPGRQDAQDGEKVTVVGLWDSDEEARMVGERIEALRRDGHPLSEIAILVRAGFQTRAFEERLITLGVPYRVVGGLRFYERAEIRDALAYMRVLVQPADDLAFERIVNVPRRGVGNVALRTLHTIARTEDMPLSAAAAHAIETSGVKGKVKEALGALLQGFARWRGMLETDGHVVTVQTLLDESGYTTMWQQDKSAEAPGRLENLKELVRAVAEFETLAGLPRPRVAGDGERRGRRCRPREPDDAARCEGAGVRHRVPARLGRRRVSQPALDGRVRQQGPGGGTPPCLCRPDPRAPPRHRQPRGEPPDLRQLAEQHAQPLPGRTAGCGCGAQRFGRAGTRCAHRRGDQLRRPVPDGGASSAGDRGMGTAGTPGARRAVPVGARVFHQKFGYGTVTATDDDRLDVAFDKAGQKRVLDRFVERA